MKIPKPTVGRIVEYEGKYAALVVEAYDDGRVALAVFQVVGLATPRYGTALGVPYNAHGAVHSWRYPPRCEEMIDV
jgi:hypothetical protein